MSRLWVIIILAAAAYIIIKGLMGLLFLSKRRKRSPSGSIEGGEMVRDPVCGIYIPKEKAIEKQVKGEAYFFCSRECLEKYRLSETPVERE